MHSFTLFFLFSLLSCASTAQASFRRRFLFDPPLTNPPFFPVYTSSPPPPPPPPPVTTFTSSFPTFPANISALVLPRSPKPHSTSPKPLLPALTAVLLLALAIGLTLFLYGRWRGKSRYFKDEAECSASDTKSNHEETCSQPRNIANRLSVATTTSQVFYLGNVVTSRSDSVEECDQSRNGVPGTSFVKLESPEIRPLPPLPARGFEQMNYESDYLTEEDDEEDVFYSPLASFSGERNFPYSTCSCSSSNSCSPARSHSVTMSPPMSSTILQQHSNPRYSDVSSVQNLESPSPERRVWKNNRHGSSLRMFSFWNQNVGFPRISSASTSPDRGTNRTPDAYTRSSLYSSVSTSPDGFFRKILESSPPKWNDLSRNVKSVLLSSRRDFCINIGESSRNLNLKLPRGHPNETAAASPPPRSEAQLLMSERIPEPPPLVPPSQPFMVQKPGKKLSSLEPMEQPKLNQLHWDEPAWVRLRSSSLKLNKEMVETLFIANSSNANMKQRSLSYNLPNLNQERKDLYPRKAQDIATLLQVLNLTTKDVSQAVLNGDCDALGVELLECLSRMAPCEEEENELKSFSDDLVSKLIPAERFLKELLDVPSGFKRIDALLYAAKFDAEIEHIKRSFGVVQAACEEVKNSRMFSKLVEAILMTGSRMNVGVLCSHTAQTSKLDSVLKLAEIKGLDARTSVLHFVVQEIMKSEVIVQASNTSFEEGHCKKQGLEAIKNLSLELANVKKSAEMDYTVLRSDVSKVYQGLKKIKELLLLSEESRSSEDQWQKFQETMTQFLETTAREIKSIEAQEISTLCALEEVTEYFHGDSTKEEAHPLRIFVIVRDFLSILDKVCKEIVPSYI